MYKYIYIYNILIPPIKMSNRVQKRSKGKNITLTITTKKEPKKKATQVKKRPVVALKKNHKKKVTETIRRGQRNTNAINPNRTRGNTTKTMHKENSEICPPPWLAGLIVRLLKDDSYTARQLLTLNLKQLDK